jgi:D-xylose transport system substrate-binding protein
MRRARILAAAALISAAASFGQPARQAGAETRQVALSWAGDDTPRAKYDLDRLKDYLSGRGFLTRSASAAHRASLQSHQIRYFADQGVSLIVIFAEDSGSCAKAVEYATSKGVMTIAFDRFIPTTALSLYVSYDWREIGREQARGILALRDHGRFVLLGGSPTDPAATVFREGQMEALRPFVEAGAVEIVASRWAENWDPGAACDEMLEVIEELGADGFDAVVASNDGTALGALNALCAYGLAGKIPVSGQDATADGLKSIRRGELSFTILKDIGRMPVETIALALDLLDGKEPAGSEKRVIRSFAGPGAPEGEVLCAFLPLVRVDAKNMDDVMRSVYAFKD